MDLVVRVLIHLENLNRNKHVESVWLPCLDEGSTPSSSTEIWTTLKKIPHFLEMQDFLVFSEYLSNRSPFCFFLCGGFCRLLFFIGKVIVLLLLLYQLLSILNVNNSFGNFVEPSALEVVDGV